MQLSQIPSLMPLPFAANGIKNVIPEASQIGIIPGAASLNDGFPPLTFTAIAAGGVPPSGQDFNGILNLLSQNTQWQNAGGFYTYSSSFSATINGYPRLALLAKASGSGYWLNIADDNPTNPDAGGGGWVAFDPWSIQAAQNINAPDSGSVNACAVVLTPEPVQLTAGMLISIKTIANTNTAAATLSVNGSNPLPILLALNTPLTGGELEAGYGALVRLNAIGNAWELLWTGAGQFVVPSPLGNSALQLNQLKTGNGSLVGYQLPIAGSIVRSMQSKFAEKISVTDFGADPTGVNDSTEAFSLAAQNSTYPYIPGGTYLLETDPSTPAIWDMDFSAKLSGPGILPGNVVRIPVGNNQVTLYVDEVNGTDGLLRGLGTGTLACKTIQGAFNNLAQQYDFSGNNSVPLIQCAAGQTFSGGLALQGGQTCTPFLCGINQVTIDGALSTIENTKGNTIFIRGYPIWLRLQNMTLSAPGGGNLVEVYNGGCQVEFNGGITFGACTSDYAQLSATRYGRISSYPGSTGYTISGGGGIFAQAMIGGRIELEGFELVINPGLTYTVAFVQASGAGSSVDFNQVAFTGSNITGPSFMAQLLGGIDLHGWLGGQTINLPLAGGGGAPGGPAVVTGNFTNDGCGGYLPGSSPGSFGNTGGQISQVTPCTVTGAGSSPVVQEVEPAMTIIMGTGNGSTAGTQYSLTVNFATTSDWQIAHVGTNEPGALSDLYVEMVGPSGDTPGYAVIYYTGTGYTPDGKAIYLTLFQTPIVT